MKRSGIATLDGVSNDGKDTIELSKPYVATVAIRGVAAILFHAWSVEAVQTKAGGPKGSAGRKRDDIESYVTRDAEGFICIPGTYVVGSMTCKKNGAAKYRPDPRSPRKSARDLYAAGVVAVSPLARIHSVTTGKPSKDWDYLDRRRAVIQQSGITRTRPAFLEGWTCEVQLMTITPELISSRDLHACLVDAGRLVGIGDFRPTFGRFQIDSYKVGLE